MYSIEFLENSIFRAEDFDEQILIGEGRHYYVLKDNMPYCHVVADPNNLFMEGAFFNDHLVIASDDKVLFISLTDFKIINTVTVSYYVSDILATSSQVFIFDCTGIIAINEKLQVQWENHDLAIDGVKFVSFIADDTMEISCEMDPPFGWENKVVSISDGREISRDCRE